MALVISLDTRDISNIARDPSASASQAVLRRLQAGEVELGLSIVHLIELADPNFQSYSAVRDFLNDVPLRIAVERSHVIDEEVACVCARISRAYRRPPRVFVKDFSDWPLDMPAPPTFDLVHILEYLRSTDSEREKALGVAEHGAALSVAKAQAAVAQDRDGIGALYVRDHLHAIRPRVPHYCGGYSAGEVISKGGGLSSFPMLFVTLELARVRLVHPGKKTTRNDIIDEHLVSYSPYAAATTLDRSTHARYREGKLPHLDRVTSDLGEVPTILERVLRGELSIAEST